MISICLILFLLTSILTPSYSQGTCASGWVQNGESCYLIRAAVGGFYGGTWDQCNAYCTTASYPGATMLCINNAAENTWIHPQFRGAYFWIGYTDMLPYGGGKGTKQYGWVTGCSSTYTNWYPGEPDNWANNEDYAEVHPHTGQWFDEGDESTVQQHLAQCGCQYKLAFTTTPSSRPTANPSSGLTFSPSSGPSAIPSSGITVAQSSASSGPTSSPTATHSFRPSVGDVYE